jgi:4-hydroxybenzoate polyprenyltransferase|tara:strand:- start:3224 stop:4180 length:957 start_codon:yes stop_codon:yes gene_type:complete
MTQSGKSPEGQVADAVKDNWVDRLAPAASRPYLRLSRADRPIGTWLLYIPCMWGVLLAALHDGNLQLWDAWLILASGAGAWLMRGAGCTWNDITDRHFDVLVARTRSRPIPSGQVSVRSAIFWIAAQALIAFCILLTFGQMTIIVGIASIGFVAIYPFAKRFTWWPQIFLGIAFNWGALLGWVAHTGRLEWPAIILYLSGIAWTLFYDTIYAHQDVDDDALIGVKSTARLFGNNSPRWLLLFLGLAVGLMSLAIWTAAPNKSLGLWVALLGPLGLGLHMTWQLGRLNINQSSILLKLFRTNRECGLLPVLFFAVAAML